MEDKGYSARSTAVKECTCKHEFQDKRYGKNMRLMNPIKEKSDCNWRCTVCGREHP